MRSTSSRTCSSTPCPRRPERMLSALREVYGEDPASAAPELVHAAHRSIRVGSWMGGDRDGNPFVTAQVTAEALRCYRAAILEHYHAALGPLIEGAHALRSTSSGLRGRSTRRSTATSRIYPRCVSVSRGRNASERYRLKLNAIAVRLERTISEETDGAAEGGELGGYRDVSEMPHASGPVTRARAGQSRRQRHAAPRRGAPAPAHRPARRLRLRLRVPSTCVRTSRSIASRARS